MPTKLARKSVPAGFSADDFKYAGRPAKEQGDFGDDVGVADMACVNQFGSNNDKFYHGGVVKANGKWFVYLEWGRRKPGRSWNGGFAGQDFQFVQCASEGEARAFFRKQLESKNIKRLEEKKIEGKTMWVGKKGKDGYVVQSLATRETGLPDAYSIKDDSGVAKKVTKKAAKKKVKASGKKYHPQVLSLTKALVGGTIDYARAAQKATGVVPSMAMIAEVRDDYIPAALSRIAKIGDDLDKQLRDKKLQQISNLVASLVPRPIPRGGSPEAVILSSKNILEVQQDLDAFENALQNEDFETEAPASDIDCDSQLNAEVRWIDPSTAEGKWLEQTFQGMTNNRHSNVRGKMNVANMFAVVRSDRDKLFEKAVREVAKLRGGKFDHRAGLQPRTRADLGDLSDASALANVFLGIHGTRAVNVAPILQSNLRLPKSLKGVHITGAAFGHGIYFATDWKKSWGYTGYSDSFYGSGGNIKGRQAFMFLTDTIMGKAHMARQAMWDQTDCPRGCDSIAAMGGHASVQNDEHIIFNPDYQRIRYIIEGKR